MNLRLLVLTKLRFDNSSDMQRLNMARIALDYIDANLQRLRKLALLKHGVGVLELVTTDSCSGCCRIGAMTFFIFFAAAAGTRIVSAWGIC